MKQRGYCDLQRRGRREKGEECSEKGHNDDEIWHNEEDLGWLADERRLISGAAQAGRETGVKGIRKGGRVGYQVYRNEVASARRDTGGGA